MSSFGKFHTRLKPERQAVQKVSTLLLLIIIITGQGDLRLAPTSPVQAKIQ